MPAHTDSWFYGLPILQGNGNCGFDPTTPTTYQIVGAFFKEVSNVFPEAYLHIGGDELDYCKFLLLFSTSFRNTLLFLIYNKIACWYDIMLLLVCDLTTFPRTPGENEKYLVLLCLFFFWSPHFKGILPPS